ncbi:hypothetical protein [Vibrio quintilis]|uniref:Uncharacterized protein n=1 Tax=Vibrio quintilis TaxID=1117707 RepID=A0A1M7YPD3_9VIBR|nr:hypothetical protein [Vibrio quintilis]SHO54490.1 hypothetical protein VQ7734_00204 [Vibrio quintilis]
MTAVHFKGDFCAINAFKPDACTLNGVRKIHRIINLFQILDDSLMGLPVFQIFNTRKKTHTEYNIPVCDWHLLALALSGLSDSVRARLKNTADKLAEISENKADEDFWKCVSDALG